MQLVTKRASGLLRCVEGKWTIELSDAGLGDMRLDEHATEIPVRLLYWSDPVDGTPSEIEAISSRQQLDIAVVAEGLEAEGALSIEADAFLKRLNLEAR